MSEHENVLRDVARAAADRAQSEWYATHTAGIPLSVIADAVLEAIQRHRADEIAIAMVTEAPREDWPAPDRMKMHGVWYIPDPSQADIP